MIWPSQLGVGHLCMAGEPVEEPSVGGLLFGSCTPWWLYLVIIIGANYLRRAVLPDASTPPARVVIALAVSAVVFVAITIIYRATARRDDTRIT